MKIKRNQVMRVAGNNNVPVRYWGRLATVKTFEATRDASGKFDGSVVLVQPRNKKSPLAVTKTKLLER